ncbi:hypothetical protein DMN91_010857 [Ooceraea biroi]|uniref:Large ribosomal subunit protein mL42 n=1 Tax=Ooceraea biroi TaxID=2015173 RepID=A0A026WIN3_OOCBI|nr:39S ribosomal protein L42, mitochondrial [Ooceraea biroi]XP_011336375.1 39S ribosomal protein L42, mitochondrial [Ooceraea biroi]XP_011336376.1 39S ribosomal protein L42, mitochondrial [Ooceraea biroi]EZA55880.1 39S ribosomal protein L42, mitochondrial [Ooceraea biroi]RLU16789.1 hypothetical protein DMN91_010857 [Ooceraea biroi]
MNPVLRAVRACVCSSTRHAKYSTLPSEAVIFMEDDTMVVCWHPEQPFPYECSLPLPEEKSDANVLRIGNKEVGEVFWRKKPFEVVEELARVTYTTKHRWYPRSRDKKARKTVPDRPYL